jgi:carbon-monoxide dehydrogenase medium subunit
MQVREHLFPQTIEEALRLLAAAGGKGRLIAGGTDLIVSLREGKQDFEVLVDTCRIPGLAAIEVAGDGGVARLGARVTMAEAERSAELAARATALAEGCAWVGGPQIRNRATLVGNVVSAQPAADAGIPLVALGAVLHLVSEQEERELPIEEAYRPRGGSTVDSTREMVTAITIPLEDRREASAYTRMMRRKALTLPVLACAVWLRRAEGGGAGTLEEARVVLGPVAPHPRRLREAEACLVEGPITAERIERAAQAAAGAASPRDSVFRGSAAFRKEMVAVVVRQSVETAWTRLSQKQQDGGARRARP